MPTGAEAYHLVAAQRRRDQLILAHLPLVRHAVGRLVARLPHGTDVENLESAGTLGLVEAANKFDPDRGVKFETFAYTRIRGAVLDELRRNCSLPQHVLEQVARVRRAYRELPAPVSVDALAAATGLSTDAVVDCLAAMRLTRTVSLEATPGVAESRLVTADDPPARAAERQDEKRVLAQAIAALPERKRLVVTLYYLEDLRLKEIAQALGLSESRVSRLLDAALFDLGEYIRAREA